MHKLAAWSAQHWSGKLKVREHFWQYFSRKWRKLAGSGCCWELSLTSRSEARNKVLPLVNLSQNQNPPAPVLVWSPEPDSHIKSKVFETKYQVLALPVSPLILTLLASSRPDLCDTSVFSAAGSIQFCLTFYLCIFISCNSFWYVSPHDLQIGFVFALGLFLLSYICQ